MASDFRYNASKETSDWPVTIAELDELIRTGGKPLARDGRKMEHLLKRVKVTLAAQAVDVTHLQQTISQLREERSRRGAPSTLNPLDALPFLSPEEIESVVDNISRSRLRHLRGLVSETMEKRDELTALTENTRTVLRSAINNNVVDENVKQSLAMLLNNLPGADELIYLPPNILDDPDDVVDNTYATTPYTDTPVQKPTIRTKAVGPESFQDDAVTLLEAEARNAAPKDYKTVSETLASDDIFEETVEETLGEAFTDRIKTSPNPFEQKMAQITQPKTPESPFVNQVPENILPEEKQKTNEDTPTAQEAETSVDPETAPETEENTATQPVQVVNPFEMVKPAARKTRLPAEPVTAPAPPIAGMVEAVTEETELEDLFAENNNQTNKPVSLEGFSQPKAERQPVETFEDPFGQHLNTDTDPFSQPKAERQPVETFEDPFGQTFTQNTPSEIGQPSEEAPAFDPFAVAHEDTAEPQNDEQMFDDPFSKPNGMPFQNSQQNTEDDIFQIPARQQPFGSKDEPSTDDFFNPSNSQVPAEIPGPKPRRSLADVTGPQHPPAFGNNPTPSNTLNKPAVPKDEDALDDLFG